MQTKIIIDNDNDVFQPDPAPEMARILRELADRIEQGNPPKRIKDVNGNYCGILIVQ